MTNMIHNYYNDFIKLAIITCVDYQFFFIKCEQFLCSTDWSGDSYAVDLKAMYSYVMIEPLCNSMYKSNTVCFSAPSGGGLKQPEFHNLPLKLYQRFIAFYQKMELQPQ